MYAPLQEGVPFWVQSCVLLLAFKGSTLNSASCVAECNLA